MTNEDPGPTGATLASYLEETGIRDEVYSAAIKDVIAWQFEQARLATGMSKVRLAAAMKTSRTQVERVLDPQNVAVSLDTLVRAAAALGKRLKVELEDAL
jgi:hypothetical protein